MSSGSDITRPTMSRSWSRRPGRGTETWRTWRRTSNWRVVAPDRVLDAERDLHDPLAEARARAAAASRRARSAGRSVGAAPSTMIVAPTWTWIGPALRVQVRHVAAGEAVGLPPCGQERARLARPTGGAGRDLRSERTGWRAEQRERQAQLVGEHLERALRAGLAVRRRGPRGRGARPARPRRRAPGRPRRRCRAAPRRRSAPGCGRRPPRPPRAARRSSPGRCRAGGRRGWRRSRRRRRAPPRAPRPRP